MRRPHRPSRPGAMRTGHQGYPKTSSPCGIVTSPHTLQALVFFFCAGPHQTQNTQKGGSWNLVSGTAGICTTRADRKFLRFMLFFFPLLSWLYFRRTYLWALSHLNIKSVVPSKMRVMLCLRIFDKQRFFLHNCFCGGGGGCFWFFVLFL